MSWLKQTLIGPLSHEHDPWLVGGFCEQLTTITQILIRKNNQVFIFVSIWSVRQKPKTSHFPQTEFIYPRPPLMLSSNFILFFRNMWHYIPFVDRIKARFHIFIWPRWTVIDNYCYFSGSVWVIKCLCSRLRVRLVPPTTPPPWRDSVCSLHGVLMMLPPHDQIIKNTARPEWKQRYSWAVNTERRRSEEREIQRREEEKERGRREGWDGGDRERNEGRLLQPRLDLI